MEATADSIAIRLARTRRFAFRYLLSFMLAAQACWLLLLAGVRLKPWPAAAFLVAVVPLGAATLAAWRERRAPARAEPIAWVTWAVTGILMFGVWAGSYFLAGKLVDPERVRYLPAQLEALFPMQPAFTLVYVLLYPIFLLPFFVVRERAAFRRLIAGDLILFAACSVIFVAFPVAFSRPPLPPQPWDLGAWVLSLVQGNDPPWNCLPSEHCAVALLAALATRESDRRVGAYALVTALLIGLSTLYTKQHYLVDVLAGYGIALIIYRALKRGRAFEQPQTSRAPAVSPSREAT